jgi:nucleoside-diphosphate-sugar epimerase
MLQRRPIFVPEDGANPIQFVHEQDLAHAVMLALETDLPVEHYAFNVGNPDHGSILEYVNLLADVADVDIEINHVPYRKLGIEPRAFFPFRDIPYVVDSELIATRLGWNPKYTLSSGLRHTFASLDHAALATENVDVAMEGDILKRA